MIYTSEMIQKIITSASAKKALNYISPIYGDAEYFLRILNAIGLQLDVVWDFGISTWEEIIPQLTEKLLPYWEQEYGITSNSKKSVEERRNALLNKIRIRPPMNPSRLEARLKLALGKHVRIEENTGVNQFKVWISGDDYSVDTVREIVDEAKPAHLIYEVGRGEFVESPVYFGMFEMVGKVVTINQIQPDRTYDAVIGSAIIGEMVL